MCCSYFTMWIELLQTMILLNFEATSNIMFLVCGYHWRVIISSRLSYRILEHH